MKVLGKVVMETALEAVQFWLNFNKVPANLSSSVLVNSLAADVPFGMSNFRHCRLL